MRDSATRDALLRDAWLGFALGKAVGRRVVVVGVSTGASLAAWLSAQPRVAPELVATVLFSPAFALARLGWRAYAVFQWLVVLLPKPVAVAVVHAIAGTVGGRGQPAELAPAPCTTHWPMAALLNCVEVYLSAQLALAASSSATAGGARRTGDVRTLIFANPRDDTVDYIATQRVAATIGAQLTPVTTSEHPHVISGNRSPSTSAACTELAVRFVRTAINVTSSSELDPVSV
jgi:hypothetical protein